MLRRLLLLSVIALAACVSSTGAPVPVPQGTLIVVRHSDRDDGVLRLNDMGHARAALLPEALSDLPLDAIYLPDLTRNIETAEPLSAASGLPMRFLTVDDDLPLALATLAEGKTVIWIGNSDNIRPLWARLALPGEPPVTYGEIAVLTGDGETWSRTDRFHGPAPEN